MSTLPDDPNPCLASGPLIAWGGAWQQWGSASLARFRRTAIIDEQMPAGTRLVEMGQSGGESWGYLAHSADAVPKMPTGVHTEAGSSHVCHYRATCRAVADAVWLPGLPSMYEWLRGTAAQTP